MTLDAELRSVDRPNTLDWLGVRVARTLSGIAIRPRVYPCPTAPDSALARRQAGAGLLSLLVHHTRHGLHHAANITGEVRHPCEPRDDQNGDDRQEGRQHVVGHGDSILPRARSG